MNIKNWHNLFELNLFVRVAETYDDGSNNVYIDNGLDGIFSGVLTILRVDP